MPLEKLATIIIMIGTMQCDFGICAVTSSSLQLIATTKKLFEGALTPWPP